MLKADSRHVAESATGAPDAGESALFRAAVIYVNVVVGCLVIWLALKPGDHALFTGVDDLLRLIGPLGLVLLVLWGTLRTRASVVGGPLSSRIPIVLALTAGSFVMGRGIVTFYDSVLGHAAPSPSAADAVWLCSYPMLLLGIFLLSSTALTVSTTARMVLDVLLVLTGVGAYAWYFVLGPDIVAEHAAVLTRVVNAAYPVADLALIGCMVLLWSVFRHTSSLLAAGTQRVVTLLGLGLFALVATDSIREYESLHGLVAPGASLDLGRPIGYMLVGLAAVAALTAPISQRITRNAGLTAHPSAQPGATQLNPHTPLPRVWRYLLPYASVPAVVALMIYAARAHGYLPLAVGVYVSFAILIELVLLHQFLDYRELIAFSNRNARLESLAAADPVTGLPNHRTLVSALDVELERARRYHHPCTALFLDLDHFKALNDSYGHPTGDSALREFASVVRTALRGIDTLARWGGEEFVAVLPETDIEPGLAVAERVRAAVAAHTFWAARGAHLTCSIGVASYPGDAENRDELIEMADRAMYAAKHLGRNQVRPASDPAVARVEADTRTASAHEEAALLGTVEALAALGEAHDHPASKHGTEVAALASRLALALGLDTSDAHTVGLAGRLHDIGRVAIPDSILSKPARLTEEEWSVVRQHPAVGAAAVCRVPALRVLAPIIRAHHEFWNGQGYPEGLAGEAIPLCARILAVADAYNALRDDRPYRPARTPTMALAEIERCSGAQFDPRVVEALRSVLSADVAMVGV
jgi:diguanylate cyclase (GGDEF)-like protein